MIGVILGVILCRFGQFTIGVSLIVIVAIGAAISLAITTEKDQEVCGKVGNKLNYAEFFRSQRTAQFN